MITSRNFWVAVLSPLLLQDDYKWAFLLGAKLQQDHG